MTARFTRPAAAVAALGLILIAAPAWAQQPVRSMTDAPAAPISLGDAARLAAGRAPSAVGARARAAQGDARVAQVRSEFLPQLGTEATMDGGPEATALPTGTYLGGAPRMVSERTVDVRMQATQRLFDLPTLRRLRATSTEADAIAFSALAAEEQAAGRGALAYLELQRADARVAARVADSALAAELLGIARQQLNAGTAIALDVTRAESQLASTVSQLIAARSARARAELELHHALALPLGSDLVLADSLRAPGGDLTVDEQAAIQTAMNRRGDLLSAKHARRGRAEGDRRGEGGAAPGGAALHQRGEHPGRRVRQPRLRHLRQPQPVRRLPPRLAGGGVPRASGRRMRSGRTSSCASRWTCGGPWWTWPPRGSRWWRPTSSCGWRSRKWSRPASASAPAWLSNADVIQASLTLNHARDIVVDARTTWHQARVRLAAAQGTVTEIQ
ncbi:MAG: TolC family protein [Gemmatimonadetes bacterium]|nr:TolC family protein [Gemmatimonadota bacterium]